MSEMMKHTGIVVSTDKNNNATVEVMREHACTGCGDKSSCTMSDGNNIRITFRNAGDLSKGDHVEISIDTGSFMRSLLTVYAVPLVLMLAAALVTDSLQNSQLITAAATLCAPTVYFVLLKFIKKGKPVQTYRKI